MDGANEYSRKKIKLKDLKRINQMLSSFNIENLIQSIYKKLITKDRYLDNKGYHLLKKNLEKSLAEKFYSDFQEQEPKIFMHGYDSFNESFELSLAENIYPNFQNNENKIFMNDYNNNLFLENLINENINYDKTEELYQEITLFNDNGEANNKHVFTIKLASSNKNDPLTKTFFWLNIYPKKRKFEPLDDIKPWGESVLEAYNNLKKQGINLPEVIESKKDEKDNYYIILENINGKSFNTLAKEKNLEAIKDLGTYLARINSAGYETGDPNLPNFILGNNNKIYLIDLEWITKSKRFHYNRLNNLEKQLNDFKGDIVFANKNQLINKIKNSRNELSDDCTGYDVSFTMWQLYRKYIYGDYQLNDAEELVDNFIKSYEKVKKINKKDWRLIDALLSQGILFIYDDPQLKNNIETQKKLNYALKAFDKKINDYISDL